MNGPSQNHSDETHTAPRRVAKPYDQADIDGEPVEYTCTSDAPFFLTAASAAMPFQGVAHGISPDNVHPDHGVFRYGDVAASSFGDDLERERDA